MAGYYPLFPASRTNGFPLPAGDANPPSGKDKSSKHQACPFTPDVFLLGGGAATLSYVPAVVFNCWD